MKHTFGCPKVAQDLELSFVYLEFVYNATNVDAYFETWMRTNCSSLNGEQEHVCRQLKHTPMNEMSDYFAFFLSFLRRIIDSCYLEQRDNEVDELTYR